MHILHVSLVLSVSFLKRSSAVNMLSADKSTVWFEHCLLRIQASDGWSMEGQLSQSAGESCKQQQADTDWLTAML